MEQFLLVQKLHHKEIFIKNSLNTGSGGVGVDTNFVRVYSTKHFLNSIVKPRDRNRYTGISCEISYHDSERAYICASNCIFQQSQPGNPSWGNTTYTSLQVGDDDTQITNRWRSIPQGGVIKHGETHDFRCNHSNSYIQKWELHLLKQENVCMVLYLDLLKTQIHRVDH